MRIMPFRTASAIKTTIHLEKNGQLVPFEGPIEAWEYLTRMSVVCEFDLDLAQVRMETGLRVEDCGRVVAALQVDCPSTSWRHLELVPLGAGTGNARVTVGVPPMTVAKRLDARALVLLASPAGVSDERAPRFKGSRLHQSETARVILEGQGAAFPVEAVSFESVGLASHAPWHLHCSATTLAVPFMRAVRLKINTDHPAHTKIQACDPEMTSILTLDILLQLLLACSSLVLESDMVSEDDESLGATLEGLCRVYLDRSAREAVQELRSDPTEFLTSAKSKLNYLEARA